MAHTEPASPAIRLVIVDDQPVVRRGLRSLLETLPGMDGIQATRQIGSRCPDVAARVLSFFASSATLPAVDSGPAFPELSPRERDIVDLLASGQRTAAIAEQLFLSPKTVSNNLTAIFARLQVAS